MSAEKPESGHVRFNIELPETALQHLLEREWKVFQKHKVVGAYLPVGQLDGDCRECGGEWPCGPVLSVFAPLTTAIRQVTTAPNSTVQGA